MDIILGSFTFDPEHHPEFAGRTLPAFADSLTTGYVYVSSELAGDLDVFGMKVPLSEIVVKEDVRCYRMVEQLDGKFNPWQSC